MFDIIVFFVCVRREDVKFHRKGNINYKMINYSIYKSYCTCLFIYLYLLVIMYTIHIFTVRFSFLVIKKMVPLLLFSEYKYLQQIESRIDIIVNLVI